MCYIYIVCIQCLVPMHLVVSMQDRLASVARSDKLSSGGRALGLGEGLQTVAIGECQI